MANGTTRRPGVGLLLVLVAAATAAMASRAERPPAAAEADRPAVTVSSCDPYSGNAPDGVSIPDQNFARHPRCMA